MKLIIAIVFASGLFSACAQSVEVFPLTPEQTRELKALKQQLDAATVKSVEADKAETNLRLTLCKAQLAVKQVHNGAKEDVCLGSVTGVVSATRSASYATPNGMVYVPEWMFDQEFKYLIHVK